MAKSAEDKFEFPGDRESGIIGTATRTRRVWKKNGTLGTMAQELEEQNRKYPPETFLLQAGTKKRRRKAITIGL